MESLTLLATAAFGLEAVVARELQQLGYVDQQVEDGRVRFRGDLAAIARCNLWLRSADRVLVEMGTFQATDFGELFDHTHAYDWERWLPIDAAFPVQGRSVKSLLHSVPDCQRLVKKAIAERLKRVYHRDWFDETGPKYSIEVSLLRDRASLTIDTSGPGLHKRGYRTLVGQAPLKETLAAGLIQLSYWRAGRMLIDPLCGSGTIPIEAALMGRKLAPGRNRTFAAEAWPAVPLDVWEQARQEADDLAQASSGVCILGTDIDPHELKLSRRHADAAGVSGEIHFQQRRLDEFATSEQYGCIITNPPYGERLGEAESVEALYREMGRAFRPLDTWSLYVLTSHPGFEHLFGRKADRRRKLYNAKIACTYYQYPGPKPQGLPGRGGKDDSAGIR